MYLLTYFLTYLLCVFAVWSAGERMHAVCWQAEEKQAQEVSCIV